MKRIILAIVLAVCAPFAGAASPFDIPPGLARGGDASATAINNTDVRNTNTNTNVNTSRSDATAGAAAGAIGVGVQGQGQSVNINQQHIVPANQSLTYNGSYDVRNVPNVIAPNIYPTGTCMGSSSAGVGVMGFGLSLGSSWTDEDCRKQEVARGFHQMGMTADAVAVLCSVPAAAVAPSCMKATQQPAKTAAQGERGEADRRSDATVRTSSACAINKADADRLSLQVCR